MSLPSIPPTDQLALAPEAFRAALRDLKKVRQRSEVQLEEIPAPTRLAPYAVAFSADVFETSTDTEELATGRFILLYDPAGSDVWQGNFRIVTFIRADLEADVGTDPLVTEVAWTWLIEALEDHQADYCNAGGTATRVLSDSFGVLDGQGDTIDIELRASWTPSGDSLQKHLEAWAEMVCSFAGLPPVPEGVVALPQIRRN